MRDFITFYKYLAAFNPCFSRIEYFIFACYPEVFRFKAVLATDPHICTFETNDYGIVFDFNTFIIRTFSVHPFHTICLCQCKKCQTFSGNLFLCGMNPFLHSCIQQYSHAAVRYTMFHLRLRFTQIG